MSSDKPDDYDGSAYDDLKGVAEWKINCMIFFFNVLLFPVYLLNKYIVDSVDDVDDKKDKKIED
jgi:hypothetical protein